MKIKNLVNCIRMLFLQDSLPPSPPQQAGLVLNKMTSHSEKTAAGTRLAGGRQTWLGCANSDCGEGREAKGKW